MNRKNCHKFGLAERKWKHDKIVSCSNENLGWLQRYHYYRNWRKSIHYGKLFSVNSDDERAVNRGRKLVKRLNLDEYVRLSDNT